MAFRSHVVLSFIGINMSHALQKITTSRLASLLTLVLAGLFFGYDIVRDYLYEALGFHILFELLVFLLILVRLGYELKTSMQLSRDLTNREGQDSKPLRSAECDNYCTV